VGGERSKGYACDNAIQDLSHASRNRGKEVKTKHVTIPEETERKKLGLCMPGEPERKLSM
jgi:hypothetical protein